MRIEILQNKTQNRKVKTMDEEIEKLDEDERTKVFYA